MGLEAPLILIPLRAINSPGPAAGRAIYGWGNGAFKDFNENEALDGGLRLPQR